MCVCVCLCAQLLICVQLFDPMDCNIPVFCALGISQIRIIEWVAIPSFRESSKPRGQLSPHLLPPLLWQMDSLPLYSLGSPQFFPRDTKGMQPCTYYDF